MNLAGVFSGFVCPTSIFIFRMHSVNGHGEIVSNSYRAFTLKKACFYFPIVCETCDCFKWKSMKFDSITCVNHFTMSHFAYAKIYATNAKMLNTFTSIYRSYCFYLSILSVFIDYIHCVFWPFVSNFNVSFLFFIESSLTNREVELRLKYEY